MKFKLLKSKKDGEYALFAAKLPTLDDHEAQLNNFGSIQTTIKSLSSTHIIGAFSLNTKKLKLHLDKECDEWKFKYSDNLHSQAKQELEKITEYTRMTMGKLTRKVEDLDSLRFMMNLL